MLKIGHGKPGITVLESDSHHPEQGVLYEARSWFYISLDRWMDIQEFQTYKWPEDLKLGDLKSATEATPCTPIWFEVQRMKRLIKMAGGTTIWQMNVAAPDLKDRYRIAVVLSHDNYIRWNLVDIYFKVPYYKLKAKWLNYNRKRDVACDCT